MNLQISRDCLVKYIGIPYDKVDCYDLCKLFYINELDTELPDQSYLNNRDELEMSKVVSECKDEFQKVTDPKFGDLVLLRVWGMPAHVGIYVDEKRILHTQDKIGSMIENIAPRWVNRIEGYYRWPSLN